MEELERSLQELSFEGMFLLFLSICDSYGVYKLIISFKIIASSSEEDTSFSHEELRVEGECCFTYICKNH